MTFIRNIQSFIRRHDLLSRDGFYVVALSGGADSVALLSAMKTMGYRVDAAHCNFNLRGEESLRDEMFCVALCQKLGVTLHRAHFDTLTYASVHKVSIEMAARELRYHYFEQLRSDLGANGVCVAHHRDDQVETVLLNLVRGTGMTGLQGMQPRNGYVLRPMLGVSRQEVVDYLISIDQNYVVDSTNLEADAMRNKLRLNVIPLLEEINPGTKDNICRMTENLREVAKVAHQSVQSTIDTARTDGHSFDLQALLDSPSPVYTLWALLEGYGFNRTQVVEIAACESGNGHWMSPDYVAVVEYGHLSLYSRTEWERAIPHVVVPETGTFVYPMGLPSVAANSSSSAETHFRFKIAPFDKDFQIERSPLVAMLDADRLSFPLTIRPVVEGDRFVPFGMRGSKLVSDYLCDNKVPTFDRRRQLVVTDASGNIVWLVGRRIDNRVALRPGRSLQALIITF